MRKNRAKRYGTLQSLPKLVATAVLLLLPSCDPGQWFQRPVVPYDQADEVIVLSRNSPTTRYLGPDGEYVGFEQDLIDQFARRAGKRVRVIERTSAGRISPRPASA
jgi:ABC-type amino acid transport substrate-binding protein